MSKKKYDFTALAEAVLERIHQKYVESPLIMLVIRSEHSCDQHKADEITISAAEEHMDRLALSEIASALSGDYALARKVMERVNKRYGAFIRKTPRESIMNGKVNPQRELRRFTLQEIARGLKQVAK